MTFLDPDDPDLHDDLELACVDQMRGDAYGPMMASRLQRACEGVLRRKGATGAVVRATSTQKGTAVKILLPQPGKTVREIVLRLS